MSEEQVLHALDRGYTPRLVETIHISGRDDGVRSEAIRRGYDSELLMMLAARWGITRRTVKQ